MLRCKFHHISHKFLGCYSVQVLRTDVETNSLSRKDVLIDFKVAGSRNSQRCPAESERYLGPKNDP